MKKITAMTRYHFWMAVAIALLTALALPTIHFVASYQHLVGSLETDVKQTAAVITRAIQVNPEMWQYEQIRLEEVLSRRPHIDSSDSSRIFDRDGTLIAAHIFPSSPPHLSRSVELLDAGVPVAELEISRSLTGILAGTALALLVGLLLGTTLFIILRILPLRIVRRAEKQADTARYYLKSVIDLMPAILIGTDASGIINLWNLEAEKVTGIVQEGAHGKYLKEVLPPLIGECDLLKQAIMDQQILPKKRLVLDLSSEGEQRTWDLLVYPLSLHDMNNAILLMEDVTKQIQVEQVMVQTEKMMSIGALAAGLAHEINNPLAAIMQSTQVALRRLSPDHPINVQTAEQCNIPFDKITQYLERRQIPSMLDAVLDASARAADIIQDMLRFSRNENTEKAPVDIHKLIDRSISFAEKEHSAYNFNKINVYKSYGDLPPVTCSSTQIQQVLLNIIKNGAEAMASCSQMSQPQLLFIHTEQMTDRICINIEDNGPGMSDSVCKRIFEPFYTTKTKAAGTGLGLSISYFIITHSHKGTIVVTSAPGRGAKFTIELPILPPKEAL